MSEAIPTPDVNNVWRLETNNAAENWARSPYPDAERKYFMVSADGHVQEPKDVFKARIGEEYWHRLPGVSVDKAGDQFQKTEGFRPSKINLTKLDGEDAYRQASGRSPQARLDDLAKDGVDAEILFPNLGLTVWATPDAEFSQMMCRAWNEWAWEEFGPYNHRLAPMACIAAGDIPGAIKEIERVAKLGFKGLALPCKPVWGPPNHEDLNYNLPEFDPLWACISDVELPMTFHVSTGRDPRTSRGNGGAVINYAVHSLAPTMEPIANFCASGVLDRLGSAPASGVSVRGGERARARDADALARLDGAPRAHAPQQRRPCNRR
ncbi:MAG: amidohydrolase family protein [Pseudomonadota bacterium]